MSVYYHKNNILCLKNTKVISQFLEKLSLEAGWKTGSLNLGPNRR